MFNIDSEVMYSEYFRVEKKGKIEKLYYKETLVKEYPEVVLYRCYKEDVMKHFENRGTKVINSAKGMGTIRDKYKTHLVAKKLGILQPKFLSAKAKNFNYISACLGIPFVMKKNTGSKGEYVYLVNSKEEYDEVINSNNNMNFMYQEYLEESKGSDYRLYIVGNKIIGCINRMSKSEDFRANISRGGEAIESDVPSSIKEQSLLIAKTLGLEICSIDYLKTGDHYYFCEGNGSAGFLAFTKLGYNMQKIFMQYISEKYTTE